MYRFNQIMMHLTPRVKFLENTYKKNKIIYLFFFSIPEMSHHCRYTVPLLITLNDDVQVLVVFNK